MADTTSKGRRDGSDHSSYGLTIFPEVTTSPKTIFQNPPVCTFDIATGYGKQALENGMSREGLLATLFYPAEYAFVQFGESAGPPIEDDTSENDVDATTVTSGLGLSSTSDADDSAGHTSENDVDATTVTSGLGLSSTSDADDSAGHGAKDKHEGTLDELAKAAEATCYLFCKIGRAAWRGRRCWPRGRPCRPRGRPHPWPRKTSRKPSSDVNSPIKRHVRSASTHRLSQILDVESSEPVEDIEIALALANTGATHATISRLVAKYEKVLRDSA